MNCVTWNFFLNVIQTERQHVEGKHDLVVGVVGLKLQVTGIFRFRDLPPFFEEANSSELLQCFNNLDTLGFFSNRLTSPLCFSNSPRLDHAPDRVSTTHENQGLDVNVFWSCFASTWSWWSRWTQIDSDRWRWDTGRDTGRDTGVGFLAWSIVIDLPLANWLIQQFVHLDQSSESLGLEPGVFGEELSVSCQHGRKTTHPRTRFMMQVPKGLVTTQTQTIDCISFDSGVVTWSATSS